MTIKTTSFFKALAITCSLFLGTKTNAQTWVPGQSYFNSNNYAEYIYGTLPIIISAPHGGSLTPSTIPDRTDLSCGVDDATTVKDLNTQEMARALDLALTNLFGAHPHTIINRLHRIKLDMNRAQSEAACGSAIGETTWVDYHNFIDSAQNAVLRQYGKGIFIDLHGQGHAKQRNEIGYLLTAATLRQSVDSLNTSTVIAKTSIKNSITKNATIQSSNALIKGPKAFGTLLANAGYPSVPSQQDPAPLVGDDYFNGGYNTARWGSRDSGTIDAFQIEMNLTGVRDNTANINAFAAALAQAIKTYLGDTTVHLKTTPFTAGNLLVGKYLTTPTTVQKISLAEINAETGVAVQSLDLPSTGAQAIGLTNVSTDGQLNISGNGDYVTMTGYGLEDGSSTSITASATNRVVGRLDASTNYQSYVLANSSAGFSDTDPFNLTNIRSAFTTDGNKFYVVGGSTSSTTATTGGIWYFQGGKLEDAAQIIPTPNTRFVFPYNGQLYAAAQATGTLPQGFYKIGTGLPETTADSTRLFTPNNSAVIGFSFSPDGTVCYLCMNSGTAHIEKWKNTGGVWSFLYNIVPSGISTAPRGMAIKYSGNNASIFVTYGTQIVKVSDAITNASAATATFTSTILYTETASGTNLRGLSLTPGTSSTPVVLPVTLLSFDGALATNKIVLRWAFSDAQDLSAVFIERSEDGNSFLPIGQVNGISAIQFLDEDYKKGLNFYRLKLMDKDGHFTYSKRIVINVAGVSSLKIYPNPANDFVMINYEKAAKNANISILSADGKLLQKKTLIENSTSTSLDISNLQKGFYTLMMNSNGITTAYKLVK